MLMAEITSALMAKEALLIGVDPVHVASATDSNDGSACTNDNHVHSTLCSSFNNTLHGIDRLNSHALINQQATMGGVRAYMRDVLARVKTYATKGCLTMLLCTLRVLSPCATTGASGCTCLIRLVGVLTVITIAHIILLEVNAYYFST